MSVRSTPLVLSLPLLIAACAPADHSGGPRGDGGSGGDDAGGTFADGGPGRDGGNASCTDGIDVVFALDVSSSMDFVIDDLQADLAGVVEAAAALAPDPHFGLIPFVDNHVIDTTGPLEGGMVHTGAATLNTALEYYRTTYLEPNRNPADGPSGPTFQNPVCEENALDALHAAAADFPWRERATRIVIVATDDTFLERPDNYGDKDGDGDTTDTAFPREGDYPAAWTVPETVTALQGAEVRVFSFSRRTPPGILSRCGTPRRFDWSAIANGWSQPYGANPPIPDATDGRDYDLAAVQSGSLSLAETINDVVLESHCVPID